MLRAANRRKSVVCRTGANRAFLNYRPFYTTHKIMKRLHCVQLLTYSSSTLARDILKRFLQSHMQNIEWCEEVEDIRFGKAELQLWLAIKSGLGPHKVGQRLRKLIGDIPVSIIIGGVSYPYIKHFSKHELHCCLNTDCMSEGMLCCMKKHTCV